MTTLGWFAFGFMLGVFAALWPEQEEPGIDVGYAQWSWTAADESGAKFVPRARA